MSAILRGKGHVAFEVVDEVLRAAGEPDEKEMISIDSEDIMVFEGGMVLFVDPASGFQKVFPPFAYLYVCVEDVEYSMLNLPKSSDLKAECPRCHGDPQSLPLGRCPKGCRA
jgi:hypothetical protein